MEPRTRESDEAKVKEIALAAGPFGPAAKPESVAPKSAKRDLASPKAGGPNESKPAKRKTRTAK